MISYVISGTCVICGAYLATLNSGAWGWFLGAGTLMFLSAVGSEIKKREEN